MVYSISLIGAFGNLRSYRLLIVLVILVLEIIVVLIVILLVMVFIDELESLVYEYVLWLLVTTYRILSFIIELSVFGYIL